MAHTFRNHWPAFSELKSVQLKSEASSYCLSGNTRLTFVVLLRVRSLMRNGTPSRLQPKPELHSSICDQTALRLQLRKCFHQGSTCQHCWIIFNDKRENNCEELTCAVIDRKKHLNAFTEWWDCCAIEAVLLQLIIIYLADAFINPQPEVKCLTRALWQYFVNH